VALRDLVAIDVAGMDPSVRNARFLVACDVDNPLIGLSGASFVYGPQKGAGPDDVDVLEVALARFAEVIRRDLGIDVRNTPGAGAAGGLGAALVAFLGADLRPGIDVVMEMIGFAERLEGADLVLTGEGTLDAQSLRGKVPVRVAQRALEAGTEVAVLCGRAEVRLTGVVVESLVERFGEDRAMADAAGALHDLAAMLASGPLRPRS
jgi:glycerate kinase